MKSPKFETHFNKELGQKFYSERDYTKAMNKAGLEPYRPDKVKKSEPKKYERSAWGNAMYQDIRNRGGRAPGDKFIKELEKRGYSQKSADNARRIANDSR